MRLAPEWVPWTALVIGGAGVLRFALGREPTTVRLVAIGLSAALGLGGAAVTWRLRERAREVDVPEATRSLLRSTPLGVAERR